MRQGQDSSKPLREHRFLQFLIALTLLTVLASGWNPEVFLFWLFENVLVFVLLAALVFSYRRVPLSNASYLLIYLFLALHEWGAHCLYNEVPLGEWLKPLLQSSRNHYDRVLHFLFGFLLGYPMLEVVERYSGVRGAWRWWIPVEATLAFSAVYELLEWLVVLIYDPTIGGEFIGMQGDLWDAQKDMALALGGVLLALCVAALLRATGLLKASTRAVATTPVERHAVEDPCDKDGLAVSERGG
jgi:putative membrane protein